MHSAIGTKASGPAQFHPRVPPPDRPTTLHALLVGVGVVRYTFTVMDLHHLLLSGLPAHYINFTFREVSPDRLFLNEDIEFLTDFHDFHSDCQSVLVFSEAQSDCFPAQ